MQSSSVLSFFAICVHSIKKESYLIFFLFKNTEL